MTEQTPYEEGWEARSSGYAACRNPYPKGSEDRRRWRKGWLDLDNHFAERDECLDEIGWFG